MGDSARVLIRKLGAERRRRDRLTPALGLAALLLAVVAASCSSGGGGGGTPSTGPSGGGGSVLTVKQSNYQFSPATFSVKSGSTITVTNTTAGTTHTFTVTGQSIDITNNPGQSQSVTITLPPGTYPFICRFHSSQGMKGTLTVTSG